jgi:hypothetical protein
MRKFAIVLSVLAAALFVGGTAQAQSLSIHIGDGRSGVSIYSGHPHGGWNRGWDDRRWDRRGWDNRRWDYPPRVHTPAPIYRDRCNTGCGGSDVIMVRVPEVVFDRFGRPCQTGRYRLVTAYYDYRYGGYVYTDQMGQLRVVRR